MLSDEIVEQPARLLDHRQMAEAPLGHQRQHLAIGITAGAGLDVAGHELVDPPFKQGRAVLGEAVDDVSLRQDTGDRLAVGTDHDGADAVRP